MLALPNIELLRPPRERFRPSPPLPSEPERDMGGNSFGNTKQML